jgi:predicted enzyme related to lactoylglutathione lyase
VKTKGLIEIILYVQDMHAQVVFYRDNFGLSVSYPSELPDYGTESWVTLNTGQCTLALHAGGSKRFGQDAPKIVFGVGDIHAAHDELLGRGVRLGEVRPAAPGVWVCDGIDPEGNKFSIESHE